MDAIEIGRRTIEAEARGLSALSALLDSSFTEAVDLLGSVSGRIICTGLGKSGHIAKKVAASMASTGTPAIYVHPTEGAHGDIGMIIPGDGVFVFSKSGHTVELEPIISHAKDLGIPIILVSENGTDGLGFHANATVRIPVLPEAWFKAPSVSTAMQLAVGDAVAVALTERRGFSDGDFLKLHPGGAIGRAA